MHINQRIQVPPSSFQTAAIMTIADELVGIATATVSALPVDGCAWLLIRGGLRYTMNCVKRHLGV